MAETDFDLLKSAAAIAASSSSFDWERCRTIVLIVHGVGDQRADRLTDDAERGFDAYISTRRWESFETRWASTKAGDSLLISTPEGGHLILPYLWSRSDRIAKGDFYVETFFDALSAITKVFISLKHVDRSKSIVSIVVFLLIIGITTPVLIVALVGSVYLLALIIAVLPVILHSFYSDFLLSTKLFHEKWSWWYTPLFFIVLAQTVVGFLMFLSRPIEVYSVTVRFWASAFSWLTRIIFFPFTFLIDVIGDIAGYLDYEERRGKVSSEMTAALTELRSKSPKARLVVVGHSLGSVLVTHAIASMPLDETSQWNCLLVTLGSPLRLLNWLYPDEIKSPEELAALLASANIIRHWHNAWRKLDYVGRSIFRFHSPICSESAIGWGEHSNYFGDLRVWKRIIQLIESRDE